VLEHVAANVTLADGALHLDRLTARLGGGELSGAIVLSGAAPVPALSVNAVLKGAAITSGVFDLPVDLTAGTLDGTLSMAASGYSPAGLLATLHGDVALAARNGQMSGFALGKIAPLIQPRDPRAGDNGAGDDGIRAALDGGVTPFEALTLAGHAERGTIVLGASHMAGPGGEATATGSVNLPGGSADLRIALRPAMPDPPEIGLRLTGPFDALQRSVELAGIARWRVGRDQAASAPPATPPGTP
jgi:AsmA protein